MKNHLTTLLTLAILSPMAYAQAPNDSESSSVKRHSFGLNVAGGGARFKGSSSDGDGITQSYVYYNYAFNKSWSIEGGLLAGTANDDWHCTSTSNDDSFSWSCNRENKSLFDSGYDDLDYAGAVIAVKGQIPLSKRNSLYGKLGATLYGYEMSRGKTRLIDEDGTGALLEFGWQYRWDFGLGLNAGYQHVYMGDLKTSALHAGISYAF